MCKTLDIIRHLAAFAIFVFAAMAISCIPALAAESTYVIDDYGLLDSSSKNQMESQAQSLSEDYGVGTYLLIVDDIGSNSSREFAKTRWNKDGLGVGDDDSGILFMIAVDSRDYVTITHGDGISYFTDYRIEEMEDEIVDYLRYDQWEPACYTYLDLCKSTLQYAEENGEPIDIDDSSESMELGEKLPVALGAAFIFAIIVMIIVRRTLKGQLKSVATGKNAQAYLQDHVDVTHSSERHLGTTVSKTPIPKNEDHGPGGSTIDIGGFGGSRGGKF